MAPPMRFIQWNLLMSSPDATFLFGLYEVRRALHPIVTRLFDRLPAATLKAAAECAFDCTHGPHRCNMATHRVAGCHISLEDLVCVAWVMHFLQRHCYVANLVRYEEEFLFAPLFEKDAAFMNEALAATGPLLWPLYWLVNPSVFNDQLFVCLAVRDTRLYITGRPTPTTATQSWAYRAQSYPQD